MNRSDPAATIESFWSAYNSVIDAACVSLPPAPSARDPDWVTDELRNLSKKKGNAWLRYCNAAKQGHDVSRHREEYSKLSRVAAEKPATPSGVVVLWRLRGMRGHNLVVGGSSSDCSGITSLSFLRPL